MDRLKAYLAPALYNIMHNKMYSALIVLGTAFTFVFISFILQLAYSVIDDLPPTSNARRTVRLETFTDVKGKYIGGLMKEEEVALLLEDIGDYENVSYLSDEFIPVMVKDKFKTGQVSFVSGSFWEMNDFEFINGRPFTIEECNTKQKYAVIKESVAKTIWGRKNVVGEKMEVQGNEYEIIGVVKDYSLFSSPSGTASFWLPYTYNKFIPSGYNYYIVDILFPVTMGETQMKEKTEKSLSYHFSKKNIEAKIDIKTLNESRISIIDGDIFRYGVGMVIFILLLIPAMNIITLNQANTINRMEEIALRRAIGASKVAAFIQVIIENLILVFIGTLLGLLFTKPVVSLVEFSVFGEAYDQITLLTNLDYIIVFIVILPLMLLFTLLSGGIPAYIVSKCNIAEILKVK